MNNNTKNPKTPTYNSSVVQIFNFYGDNKEINSDILRTQFLENLKKVITLLILKLLSFGLSTNKIIDIIEVCFGVKITPYDLKEFTIYFGKRAAKLNGGFDSIVKKKAKIIQFDEIYPSRKKIIVGAAEKTSHYLIFFKKAKEKTAKSILKCIQKTIKNMKKLEYIMTDNLRAYKKIFREYLTNIKHTLCVVHIMRQFNRKAKKYYKKMSRLKENLKNCRESLKVQEDKIRSKNKQLMDYKKMLQKYKTKLKSLKNSQNPGKTKLKNLRAKINCINSNITAFKKSLKLYNVKQLKLKTELKTLESSYKSAFVESMSVGKILKRFKQFLTTPSNNFDASYKEISQYLSKSKLKLAFDILKFIDRNLQEIRILKSTEFLMHFENETPANNVIENRFNLVKNVLKCIRNLGDSENSEYLLELLRLRLNYNRPYTQKHLKSAPIEKLGSSRSFSDFSHYLIFKNKRFFKRTLKSLSVYRKIDLQISIVISIS